MATLLRNDHVTNKIANEISFCLFSRGIPQSGINCTTMTTAIRRQCRSRSLQFVNGGLETQLESESELELELELESVDILNIFSNYLFALASSCYRQQLQLQLLRSSLHAAAAPFAFLQRGNSVVPRQCQRGFERGLPMGEGRSTWTETGTGTGVGLSALATHKL